VILQRLLPILVYPLALEAAQPLRQELRQHGPLHRRVPPFQQRFDLPGDFDSLVNPEISHATILAPLREITMALYTRKPAGRTGEVEALETTDVEDIQLLADAIVTVCQDAAYDDMTWAECDAALLRASHMLKVNWTATGTIQPPPPPEPPPEADAARHR
jgi:hypothetical protein